MFACQVSYAFADKRGMLNRPKAAVSDSLSHLPGVGKYFSGYGVTASTGGGGGGDGLVKGGFSGSGGYGSA